MLSCDLVIVGGGPAGLAAAISARENNIDNIIILEREWELGGILNQCIHNGFGLHTFGEELTGPEYSNKFIEKINCLGIKYKLNTMVFDIDKEKVVYAVNPIDGLIEIKAKAIVLAMGCRERPKGALMIAGTRCAGIMTAGTAQKLVNINGYMPGKEIVILGSGDIGLIMARRMLYEGAAVKAVVELLPYSGGLMRNIVQCLDDYNIPLLLSHSVTKIHGRDRLKGLTIVKVNEKRQPIGGTEQYIKCDTLLLSVGLLPENELGRRMGVKISDITGGAVVNNRFETNICGVFTCGNVLHVHDLVDNVTFEGYQVGRHVAEYVKGIENGGNKIDIEPKNGIRYTIPQIINICSDMKDIIIRFRVNDVYKDYNIIVSFDENEVIRKRKGILTPGQMEEVKISADLFKLHPKIEKIVLKVERR